MNKKVLAITMLTVLLSGIAPVLAEYLCLDNYTIQYNGSMRIGNQEKEVAWTQSCEYGCDIKNNACYGNPSNTYIILFVLIVVFAFIYLVFFR